MANPGHAFVYNTRFLQNRFEVRNRIIDEKNEHVAAHNKSVKAKQNSLRPSERHLYNLDPDYVFLVPEEKLEFTAKYHLPSSLGNVAPSVTKEAKRARRKTKDMIFDGSEAYQRAFRCNSESLDSVPKKETIISQEDLLFVSDSKDDYQKHFVRFLQHEFRELCDAVVMTDYNHPPEFIEAVEEGSVAKGCIRSRFFAMMGSQVEIWADHRYHRRGNHIEIHTDRFVVKNVDMRPEQDLTDEVLSKFKNRKLDELTEFNIGIYAPFLADEHFREVFIHLLIEKILREPTKLKRSASFRGLQAVPVQPTFSSFTPNSLGKHPLKKFPKPGSFPIESKFNTKEQRIFHGNKLLVSLLENTHACFDQKNYPGCFSQVVDSVAKKLTQFSFEVARQNDIEPQEEQQKERRGNARKLSAQLVTSLKRAMPGDERAAFSQEFIDSFNVYNHAERLKCSQNAEVQKIGSGLETYWDRFRDKEREAGKEDSKVKAGKKLAKQICTQASKELRDEMQNQPQAEQAAIGKFRESLHKPFCEAHAVLGKAQNEWAIAGDLLMCVFGVGLILQPIYRLVSGEWGILSSPKSGKHLRDLSNAMNVEISPAQTVQHIIQHEIV